MRDRLKRYRSTEGAADRGGCGVWGLRSDFPAAFDLDENWDTLSILFAAGPRKGHIAVTCRITLNHPSTVAMRLISIYFDHLLSLDAHIDSRTDSQALRVEYCIVGIPHNTAI